MKKILEITVRSDYGGGPEHLYQLEKYIDKTKFMVYTACPIQEPYYEKFKDMSQKTKEIPKQTFSFIALIKLIKFIRKEDIKIIHSHGRGAGFYSRFLKIFCKKIYVIHTFHGIHYEKTKNLKNKLLFKIEKFFNRITDLLICVSEEELKKGKYMHFFSKQPIVIKNGIEIERLNSQVKNKEQLKNKYKEYYKIDKNKIIIGTISRFSYPKGLEYLIQAFSKLEIENKYLILVGDGEDREKIEKTIKQLGIENQVLITGFLNNIEEIIQIFDIYISTSLYEGLPISILEAMAAEIPIIATDVVGNNSLIKHGETGTLCKVKDIESIKNALYDCIKQKNDIYTYNAKKIVDKFYNIKLVIKAIEKIYTKEEVI